MITTFFITLGSFLITAINAALPDSDSLPAGAENALNFVGYGMNQVSYFIPVDTIITVLGVMVLYQASMWTFEGILWMWHKIPIVGR